MTLDEEDWAKCRWNSTRDVGAGFFIPPSSSLQHASNFTILPKRSKIKPNIRNISKQHLFIYNIDHKHTKFWVCNECFGHSSELRCDSQLVASQLLGAYEAKKGRMEQYLKLAQSLIVGFAKFEVAHFPRSKNRMANALANLASCALYPCHVKLNIMIHPSISSTTILTTEIQDGGSWISPITNYLKNKTLPKDRNAAIKIKA